MRSLGVFIKIFLCFQALIVIEGRLHYCKAMSTRRQFTLKFDESVEDYVAQNFPSVVDFRIKSESLDARKANLGRIPNIHYIIETIDASESFEPLHEEFRKLKDLPTKPLIIGAGPAGLFCALRFAEYGITTTILERGDAANKRMLHISKYWRRGQLDTDNNVCYGEGGAGLFSDGKLITRVKSSYVQYVMNKFVEFGAPKETAWVSNPHLGSNKIRQLIGKMTESLINSGHEIHYNSRVSELLYSDCGQKVVGVKLSDGRELFSDHVILATGHSAKEMYTHLKESNVEMKAKDFAVGVRVEHPRRIIDGLQHGDFAGPELGSARYRLSWEDPSTKKGSYSFCMCPGGYVLSSGTDSDGIVVNGMSNYARNSRWSNAALVVSVRAGVDFDPSSDVLAGLAFQNGIEQLAFQRSKEAASGREVPVQNMRDFLDGKLTGELPKTSCPSGIFESSLDELLPSFITNHLKNALNVFDRRMKGFVTKEALLLAPETRTSAPVTISRDRESLESTSHSGLYPCGEGAGYAGGITSAAIDGIKVAMSILEDQL